MTGKQKSYLRSKAQRLKPIFQIGKEGLSPALMDSIRQYLIKHELVKVHVLETAADQTNALLEQFQDAGIEIVQTIGKQIVLYLHNPELKKGIVLPK